MTTLSVPDFTELTAEYERLKWRYGVVVDRLFTVGYKFGGVEYRELKNSVEEARIQTEIAWARLEKHRLAVHSGAPAGGSWPPLSFSELEVALDPHILGHKVHVNKQPADLCDESEAAVFFVDFDGARKQVHDCRQPVRFRQDYDTKGLHILSHIAPKISDPL